MQQSNWRLFQVLGGLFAFMVLYLIFDDYLFAKVCQLEKVQLIRREGSFINIFNSSDTGWTRPKPRPALASTSISNSLLYVKGKVDPPAVLLRPKGGTGNQLFQYACHYAIARKHNWPLYIFVPKSRRNTTREFKPTQREFSLDKFNIPLEEWNTVEEDWNISGAVSVNDSQILSGHYSKENVIQLSGQDYCQSESFFSPYKKELVELFKFKTEPMIDIDPEEESVAVHIRWGDFVRLNISVPLDFYREAMQMLTDKIKKPLQFYIFSDDISEVKKKLFPPGSSNSTNKFAVNFIEAPTVKTSLEEFYLMSRCKHQIIANSSFGWWAAYLNKNPNKIVIAAHHDLNFFDRAYGTETQQKYFKWEYRHIYFPIDWFVLDPFAIR